MMGKAVFLRLHELAIKLGLYVDVRLMIHLEAAFSVTNQAMSELVRISEMAV
jgi:hypothetical protein